MRHIPLRRRDGSVRAYAIVDDADYGWLTQWRWSWVKGYAGRRPRVDGRSRWVLMHRLILGLEFGDRRQGDHWNLNRLDNRRANLRVVAGDAENQQNRGAHGASGYRGVRRHGNRWQAYSNLHGKFRHLGLFATAEEADAAARVFRAAHMPFSREATS